MFSTLNDDVIHLILKDIVDTTFITEYSNSEKTPRNPGRNLLPLSLACKALREHCLPIIFRDLYSSRRGVAPKSLWKYVGVLHLRDRVPRGDESGAQQHIDIDVYVDILQSFPALRRLALKIKSATLAEAILLAASSVPTLDELAITATRWEGPQLSAFSRFTHLRSLTLSVGRWPHNTPYFYQEEEMYNVHAYLGLLASQLSHLEISSDICALSTLAEISWPHLISLEMTGHNLPREQIDVSTAVGRMPYLRALHMAIAAPCEGPWDQPPALIYGSPSHNGSSPPSLPTILPSLESLALSNVYATSDTILDELPESLVSLRVLACYTVIRSRRPWTRFRWPRRYSLPEPVAYRVVHHTARMSALTELVLALDFLPTPELVRAIAKSCPQLTMLELEYTRYYEEFALPTQSPYLDSMRDKLSHLEGLQELHISVADLTPTEAIFASSSNIVPRFLPFLESLASSLPKLAKIWLTYNVESLVPTPVFWYKFLVEVDRAGKPYVRGEVVLEFRS
ncbi:hypothetical protein PLICRDRAFT_429988 [Plicaturopsis crispa FD-325 SS-3]|uniref:F-box domain-containing protein n=1 Tax=Plicaturopsis crispa FD-325 SS-3 TaxID=944288 RepID=A0A0C9SKK0_PLICR|nr:hypothetical protein PLICRDRAFT_429988 [Plicaturopsis crispa FD-325 SS-3]